jgi:hypothetical protein
MIRMMAAVSLKEHLDREIPQPRSATARPFVPLDQTIAPHA